MKAERLARAASLSVAFVVLVALVTACAGHGSSFDGTSGAGVPAASTTTTTSPAGPDIAPPGDPVPALAALKGLCGAGGWCWRSPAPQGNQLTAVWGSSASDLWLIGARGTVLHWDGAAWTMRPPPVAPAPYPQVLEDLQQIHGTGPNDVWMTGGMHVYHWDGAAWTIRYSIELGVQQTFHGVFASAPSDVWFTADYGTLFHYDGASFAALQAPTHAEIFGAWARSATDAWFVGRLGAILHYDGASLRVVDGGVGDATLERIWGSASDTWIAGHEGLTLHFDGTRWLRVETGIKDDLAAVHGTGPNDVWFAGVHGAALHWDGATMNLARAPYDRGLFGVFAPRPGEAWVVGDAGEVDHHDPMQSWKRVVGGDYGGHDAIWGTAAGKIWVAGPGSLADYEGALWHPAAIQGPLLGLSGLHGAGTDVWAVGQQGKVYHLEDSRWTNYAVGEDVWLNAVWVRPSGSVVVVGDGGRAFRFDRAQAAFVRVPSDTTDDLYGISGESDDDAWIVGKNGTIARWDGATIAKQPSPVAKDLRAVHAAPDGAAWIVGAEATALRYVGSAWLPEPIVALDLRAVLVRSATEAYAVGSGGTICRWDGATWRAAPSPVPDTLTGIWGDATGSVWIASNAGAVLEHP